MRRLVFCTLGYCSHFLKCSLVLCLFELETHRERELPSCTQLPGLCQVKVWRRESIWLFLGAEGHLSTGCGAQAVMSCCPRSPRLYSFRVLFLSLRTEETFKCLTDGQSLGSPREPSPTPNPALLCIQSQPSSL